MVICFKPEVPLVFVSKLCTANVKLPTVNKRLYTVEEI